MAKILITGGHGFIGSHLAERLVRDGHNVFIYDNKVNRKVTHIARTEVVSYQDFFFNSWDYIIHLAAKGVVIPGCDVEMIESNIYFAKQALSTPYRTLYASSAAVHWPMTQYSWSKIYNEKLGNMHPNACGFRFQNAYGMRDNGIVGKLIKAAISGELITINGGEQQRDYTYIDDIVNAIIVNLDSKEKIIEIGTGEMTRLNDLVDVVERVTGRYINKKYDTFPEYETPLSVAPTGLDKYTNLETGIRKYYKQLTNG